MLQYLQRLTQSKSFYEKLAIVVMAGGVIWIYGCKPMTQSLFDPSKKVSAEGLEAELNFYIRITEERFHDLQKQQQFRKMIFDSAAIYASGGTINPIGVLTSLGSLLAVGATADNVRLRRERKTTTNEA